MNEDELILRRKKQSADRARAYRKRKKDPDAMPSTSTDQSDEPVSENIITTKLLHRKHLNAERCRRYRQKSKRLKSGANFNRGTCDSNTSAMQKVEESCRKCETLRNKLSVRRPFKTYTERARAFRARKEALKNAASQELNIQSSIISNTKPKTPAESSDLTRITVGVELHQEEENSQPSTSTLPMKKIKTSTERGREFGVGEKSLINLTEDIIEDFLTSSNTVNANNNNNNTGNNIKLIFVRRSAKTSTQCVRKNRAQKKALNNPASQELNVSSSIISNTDEVIETNNDGKLIMKDGTPDVCQACHMPGESVRHVSGCSHLANDLDSGYKIFDDIDIDIEQHDVLDNPRIKNIFPDITRINTDVIKYEDEDINDFDEESYETYQQDLTDPGIQECSVVLEDNSLKNNPCFCSDCEILFPTENALNSHKMTAHSFLVAVGRNKAIKSTTKSSIAAKLKFETDSNMEISNLCNHCNQVFPDEISFMKHCDELLTRKFICDECDVEFESEISLQQHLKKHPSILMHCCPICSCSFKFTARIVSHMLNQHQIDLKEEPQRVKTTLKCRFCARILKDNWSHNAHIRFVHRELFNKKCHKFECQPCNLTFLSADSEKIHQISQHAIEAETYAKSVDLDKQIKIEPLSLEITQQVSQPVIKTHSKSVDLDKQIKIEPLSPTISHRVTQHAIEAETSSKSVDQDKQIKIEPLSPTISRRVSQHDIDAETSSKSVDQDKQIKIEPLSPTITHRVSQPVIKTSDELSTGKLRCKVCYLEFESEISLQQHLNSLSGCLLYCCPICSCIYKYTPRILSHMLDQHQIVLKEEPQRVKTTLKCRFCATIPKDNCAYNAHIRYAHRELFNRKSTKFECQPCNSTFLSADSEKIHRVSQHAIEAETSSKSVDQDKQIKIEPLSLEITQSVYLDKQIKMEPLSPTISHRVSQHAIEAETSSKSVDQDKQIKMEPLSPTISHRVSEHKIEAETSSKSVDQDKQIKIEPLSPTITHRLSQPLLKTYSRSVNLNKQIKIKPPSPTIIHRVSQHEIDAETSSKSVDLLIHKQIKIEPLLPKITQTDLKQEL